MLLGIPDVRQIANHDCGPACVKAIEDFYYDRPQSLSSYTDRLAASPEDGTDPRTIERFFRNAGYGVVSGEMTVKHLKWFTGNGWPVIVLAAGHYIVIRGVARGKVYFHDPYDGLRSLELAAFADKWQDHDRVETFKNWGIAVWLP